MWMWVHVFGVTSNWILPLSSFRPWFAFAEKVFFVRSQRWLKRGAFFPSTPCAIWIRVNPSVLFWKSFHRELRLDKRVCFLLFPPQFLCQRKFPIRGSLVSSHRKETQYPELWSGHFQSLQFIYWKPLGNWFNSQTCPSDAKTCPSDSDAGRKQKHCNLTSLSPLFTLCWTFHVLFFKNLSLAEKCWSTKLIVVWHAWGLERV